MITVLVRLLNGCAALLALIALAGCAPSAVPTATPVALPLAPDRPTVLFLYTDA